MTQPALSTEAMQRARQAPRRSLGFRLWRWAHELGWRHLVAILALAFALFPVIWVISASINPIGSTLSSQKLIPSNPSFGNFRDLFSTTPFGRWMVNTILIAGGAAFINTALAAFAAYAFSRMRFRGRRTGLLSVLLVQMFPQVLAFVAIFVLMNSIGNVFPGIGDGTRLGLVLVYLGGAMGVNTWLMKGFFDTVPRDLDESAMLDGASPWQTFTTIILPLVRPVLAVIFMLSFIGTYGEYVLARVMLTDTQMYTVAVGLNLFIGDQFSQKWGQFAAGAVIAAIPTLILFYISQSQLQGGLTSGAVKG
jgi:arabinogalactan oligomer/maltooligosaccharide transport system permease protein